MPQTHTVDWSGSYLSCTIHGFLVHFDTLLSDKPTGLFLTASSSTVEGECFLYSTISYNYSNMHKTSKITKLYDPERHVTYRRGEEKSGKRWVQSYNSHAHKKNTDVAADSIVRCSELPPRTNQRERRRRENQNRLFFPDAAKTTWRQGPSGVRRQWDTSRSIWRPLWLRWLVTSAQRRGMTVFSDWRSSPSVVVDGQRHGNVMTEI